MFSLCRPFLHTTIIRVTRVTYSKDGTVSLWAIPEIFKSHVSIQIQQRYNYNSSLIKQIRQQGFRTQRGVFVKPGDTVELDHGSFIRVKKVLHNELRNTYTVEGWRFVRNAETLGISKQDPNEVYWVVHLTKENTQPAADQALVEIEDSQILRKRTMTMVNAIYPGHLKKTEVPSDEALFCRWKYVIVTHTGKLDRPLDAFGKPAAEITEASIQRLREEECDDGHNNRTADGSLRQSWLGIKKKRDADVESNEATSLLSAVEALSLDDSSQRERTPAAYTFADVCCGAGGASRGAKMAGLNVRWALDHDAAACDTYCINFPRVRLYQEELEDFVSMGRPDLRVDIMHGSFPCQPFARSNTSPNIRKNIANIAANMEIGKSLDIARPRIVTLEQTSGLMSSGYRGGRHSEHWDRILKQFTSRGYSVAWKIMNLANLGLPQNRVRLIIIASCPGEPIPSFPKPTHAKHRSSSNLKPLTSVDDATKEIPKGYPDHEIPPNFRIPRETYDGSEPTPNIVMTDRCLSAHPSGLRNFSLRELACIQGFPLEHQFARTRGVGEIKKQIGNAFAPTAAAVLFAEMKRQLLVRDGLMPP